MPFVAMSSGKLIAATAGLRVTVMTSFYQFPYFASVKKQNGPKQSRKERNQYLPKAVTAPLCVRNVWKDNGK